MRYSNNSKKVDEKMQESIDEPSLIRYNTIERVEESCNDCVQRFK